MLLEKYCYGGKKSVFRCDRCKVKLLSDERVTVRVYHSKQQTTIIKWDLCPICYKKLYRGIENFRKME